MEKFNRTSSEWHVRLCARSNIYSRAMLREQELWGFCRYQKDKAKQETNEMLFDKVSWVESEESSAVALRSVVINW